jgi:hypothetical protein
MSAPNCSYEFYTIHSDSITSNTGTLNGNTFTTHLFTPLKDVVQVSVLFANFDANVGGPSSNVCYLNVDQLSSNFNEITGNVSTSNVMSVSANPISKSKYQNPIAIFNVNNSGRTLYQQNDYSTQTQFITPIRKLSRLDCTLSDINGNPILLKSEDVFITFRFTCMRDNLCPVPFNKKKHR